MLRRKPDHSETKFIFSYRLAYDLANLFPGRLCCSKKQHNIAHISWIPAESISHTMKSSKSSSTDFADEASFHCCRRCRDPQNGPSKYLPTTINTFLQIRLKPTSETDKMKVDLWNWQNESRPSFYSTRCNMQTHIFVAVQLKWPNWAKLNSPMAWWSLIIEASVSATDP